MYLIMCVLCGPLGYAQLYHAWTPNILQFVWGQGGRHIMRGDDFNLDATYV